MALTFVQYTGNGTTKTFAVPFPYLESDHVKASVNGTATPITFDTPSLVRFSTAPANGALIDIRRSTPNESRLVDFQDGSTLTEADLDLNSVQVFYIVQEAIDLAGGTLLVNSDGSYSANGRRINALGEPISTSDAVTKGYHDGTYIPQMNTIKTQAANSATASANSATAAANSAATLAPNLVGNAGKYTKVNAGATAFEFVDGLTVLSDIGGYSSAGGTITGAVTFNSTTSHTGNATFLGTTTFSKGTTFPSGYAATFNGAVNANGPLTANGAATFNGAVTVANNATFAETYSVTFNGSVSASGVISTTNDVNITGADARQFTLSGTSVNTHVKMQPGAIGISSATGNATTVYRANNVDKAFTFWDKTINAFKVSLASGNAVLRLGADSQSALYFSSANANHRMIWDGLGNCFIHNGTATVWQTGTTASDPRLKKDLVRIDDAIGIVKKLNGYRFTWNEKAGPGLEGQPDVGVLANEVKEVLPELVKEVRVTDMEGSEPTMNVDYPKLTAVLLEAVKQLEQRVAELEAR